MCQFGLTAKQSGSRKQDFHLIGAEFATGLVLSDYLILSG